jgi:hypothetical protein
MIPAAIKIKETLVAWRGMTVTTAELPHKNLLRRYEVKQMLANTTNHFPMTPPPYT